MVKRGNGNGGKETKGERRGGYRLTSFDSLSTICLQNSSIGAAKGK